MNYNDKPTAITNASTSNEIRHQVISKESLNLARKPDPIVVDELNSQSNSSTQSSIGVPFRIIIMDFPGNIPLPPVINCHPTGVPLFVPRHLNKDNRTYRFNCAFSPPTSSFSNTDYS